MKKLKFIISFLAFLVIVSSQTDSARLEIKKDSMKISELPAKQSSIQKNHPMTVTKLPVKSVGSTPLLNDDFPSVKLSLIISLIILAGFLFDRILRWLTGPNIKYTRNQWIKTIITTMRIVLWFVVIYLLSVSIFDNGLLVFMIILGSIIILFIVLSVTLIKNFYSRFLIRYYKIYGTGDFISINDFSGEVKQINAFNTLLTGTNNTAVTFPNSMVLIHPLKKMTIEQKEKLINYRLNLPYETDNDVLNRILFEAAISSPYTYNKIPPEIFLLEVDHLNKNKIFELQVYIINSMYEQNLIHFINTQISKFLQNPREYGK